MARLSRRSQLSHRLQQPIQTDGDGRRIHRLFLTVILGLGITFELPILVFFLALFGL